MARQSLVIILDMKKQISIFHIEILKDSVKIIKKIKVFYIIICFVILYIYILKKIKNTYLINIIILIMAFLN